MMEAWAGNNIISPRRKSYPPSSSCPCIFNSGESLNQTLRRFHFSYYDFPIEHLYEKLTTSLATPY
jgi:hypothetical protein